MGPKNFLWDCPRAADVTSRSMSRGSITVCYLAQQEHINSLLTKPRRASFHLRTSMLSLIKSERLWLGGLAILRWLYLYNWRTKMLTVLYNMQAYRHYSKIMFLWGPLTLSYACCLVNCLTYDPASLLTLMSYDAKSSKCFFNMWLLIQKGSWDTSFSMLGFHWVDSDIGTSPKHYKRSSYFNGIEPSDQIFKMIDNSRAKGSCHSKSHRPLLFGRSSIERAPHQGLLRREPHRHHV